MKTTTIRFIYFITIVILFAWTTKQKNDITKIAWLLGTWENKTPRGSIYETWSKTNMHEFSGKSYIVKEQDTTVLENIQLVVEEDKLFYIPTVNNQNDGLPIRFVAKMVSDTMLIFENPQHDFPQIISYTKVGTDTLIAEIAGIKKGQERKRTFRMKRLH